VDIEMVSFKIWWYLRKNNVINFTLRDIFPCSRISSSFRNISFKKPTDYSKSTLSEKFHFGLWDTLIAENWVFGLCCTGDSFVDSFALLHDSESTVWKLLIQSKLRKSGAGDHDFTQEDLNMQLDYIKTNCNDENWILLIRTDSCFNANIPIQYKHKIIVFDADNQHLFYPPVILHARQVSNLQLLGDAWKNSEDQMEDIGPQSGKQNSRSKRFLDSFKNKKPPKKRKE